LITQYSEPPSRISSARLGVLRVAGDVPALGLLALFLGVVPTLLLPGGQFGRLADTNAELEDVDRHNAIQNREER
jgi:hypothetical protein